MRSGGATRFTREEYEDAIAHLTDAMTQLEPDATSCHCCGDSGHQAWECHHNPLVLVDRYKKLVAAAEPLHDELHRVLF